MYGTGSNADEKKKHVREIRCLHKLYQSQIKSLRDTFFHTKVQDDDETFENFVTERKLLDEIVDTRRQTKWSKKELYFELNVPKSGPDCNSRSIFMHLLWKNLSILG